MNETVFRNAHVIGGGEAVLVRGETIVAVGSIGQCLEVAGPATGAVDCQGMTMVPGLIESHGHLVEAGEAMVQKDMSEESLSEVLQDLATMAADDDDDDNWPCIAMGIGDEQFEALRHRGPDGLSERGLVLFHASGHVAIADRVAISALGRQVEGVGTVVIDEPYEDPAVLGLLQARKRRERHLRTVVGAALERYAAHGITGIHDNTWDPEIFRFLANSARGIDILSWAKGTDGQSALHLADGLHLPENITAGPIKFFLDGAFFNRTAFLHDPYPGEDAWCGQGIAAGDIASMIEPFIAQNRQCVFHAAGDRAISELLNAVETLRRVYPQITRLRLRIEHAQLIADEDYERIRDLGMVVSVQPAGATDPDRDIRILGGERARRVYPHARILSEDIPMAMGSDYPYEATMDPFVAMRSACSRTLGESLNPEQALSAYTAGSAYAGFSEDRVGSIAPGHQADFFLTEENPIYGIDRGADAVAATYTRGTLVHERAQN